MDGENAIYVTSLVSDLPIPCVSSFKVPCSECGEDVWISEDMERYWSTIRIVCTGCGSKISSEFEGPHKFVVVPENLAGIAKYLRSRGETSSPT